MGAATTTSGLKARATGALASVRARRPAIDHLVRTVGRYQADGGNRLAASVTYFGFLSFFPLVALVFFVTGFVIAVDATAAASIQKALTGAFPGLIGSGSNQLSVAALSSGKARAASGLIGFVGLLLAGLGWVDALREAIRSMWHQNIKAGNMITRKLLDIAILAGLGATLLVSLAASGAATQATGAVLRALGVNRSWPAVLLLSVLGIVLPIIADVALFLFLLARLPRVTTPLSRVARGAVLAAVGFEVLKFVGTFYVARTTSNPVYGTFAVVVGLLLWINLVSRFLLYVAAWVVTAPGDSDVAPSGTASPELADRAGIPREFAEDDDGEPPALSRDGAPTPLVPALAGDPATPGAGGAPGGAGTTGAREPLSSGSPPGAPPAATPTGGPRSGPAPASDPDADLPGADAARAAGRIGAGLALAGTAAAALVGARAVRDTLRGQ